MLAHRGLSFNAIPAQNPEFEIVAEEERKVFEIDQVVQFL